MDGKRLLVGKKDSHLYNNVWGSSNTQAMAAKFLYDLGPQDLDEKLRFNKDVNVENLFFTFLVEFGQQFIHGKKKYFIQDGFYDHAFPPVNIHLNPNEETQFDEMVLNYPNVSPSGLQLGIPTLTGPGKSVKDISHALHN